MTEQEAFRPQAEPAAEQPQNRPTPEAGAAMPRPENEVAANPRILALMQERDAADRRLQEAILDLETREQSPAFQKAKELFDSGCKIYYSDSSKYLEPNQVIFDYVMPGNSQHKECTIWLDQPYQIFATNLEGAEVLSVEEEEVSYVDGPLAGTTTVKSSFLKDFSLEQRPDGWDVIKYLIQLTADVDLNGQN